MFVNYLLTFLEGIVTFVSPCLLPLLPVYVAYFAGGLPEASGNAAASQLASTSASRIAGSKFKGALGFVAGFTVLFCALGAMAASLGGFFMQNRRALEVVCGLVIILFGFTYWGVIKTSIFTGRGARPKTLSQGFGPSFLFGMAFAVSWTPCVGAFLGSALSLAVTTGDMLTGASLLACYSLGLGVPFILSALLIDRLEGAFTWVKAHYGIINKVCGALLVLVGALLVSGLFSSWMGMFAA
ncbi:cytochrome c biogenesis CcdA family protein [Cryptobacterium curtum]